MLNKFCRLYTIQKKNLSFLLSFSISIRSRRILETYKVKHANYIFISKVAISNINGEKLAIPILELQFAVLSVRLTKKFKEQLDLNIDNFLFNFIK